MALTLRLNEAETQVLEQIKTQMNVKTSTQAISKMIMSYHSIVEHNQKLRAEKARIERDKVSLQLSINNYLSALEDLKDIT